MGVGGASSLGLSPGGGEIGMVSLFFLGGGEIEVLGVGCWGFPHPEPSPRTGEGEGGLMGGCGGFTLTPALLPGRERGWEV